MSYEIPYYWPNRTSDFNAIYTSILLDPDFKIRKSKDKYILTMGSTDVHLSEKKLIDLILKLELVQVT